MKIIQWDKSCMVNLQEGLDLPWLHVMSVNFCIKNKILLDFPLSFKFYILLLRKQKDLIWQSNCYEIVMIYSSTFFYLFFVFFSSSSSSLYFDKFKVFVHFEFVFFTAMSNIAISRSLLAKKKVFRHHLDQDS